MYARWIPIPALTLAMLVFCAGAARGLADQQKCLLAKRTAAANKAAADLKCHVKAVKKGDAVAPDCLQKSADKFAASVLKADEPGACGGDSVRLAGEADAVTAATTAATTSPDAGCASRKLAAAAKFVQARLKCFTGAAKKGLAMDPVCLQKTLDKFEASLTKAEAKAACGGDLETLFDLLSDFVVTAASFPLVDNGDGTISDPTTGLMWEKKTDDGTIHDKDNLYRWSQTGTAPDGDVFTEFLANLNTPPCFAGYCDWRLPSEDGAVPPFTGARELSGLRTCPPPGENQDFGEGEFDLMCIAPLFNTRCAPSCGMSECSCTFDQGGRVYGYWSSTSDPNQEFAWFAAFNNTESSANTGLKVSLFAARAVRP